MAFENSVAAVIIAKVSYGKSPKYEVGNRYMNLEFIEKSLKHVDTSNQFICSFILKDVLAGGWFISSLWDKSNLARATFR